MQASSEFWKTNRKGEKMKPIVEKLARHAKEQGNKVCIIDCEGKTTYKQLYQMVLGTAKELEGYGNRGGDAIVIQTTQTASFVAKVLAIHLLGARNVPIEKNCPEDRALELIQITKAKVYFCERKLAADAKWLSIDEKFVSEETEDVYPFPKADEIGDILFTTGTTGKSKGVMISHGAIAATAEHLIQCCESDEKDIVLVPTPLNHASALRRTYAAIAAGGTVVLSDGVANLKQFFSYLSDEKVTGLHLMPAMLSYILTLSGDKLKEYQNQIRFVELGSAPLLEEAGTRLFELLPESKAVFSYGSTESGCTSAYDMRQEGRIPFCIGKPNRYAKFEFADEEGKPMQATRENPGYIVTAGKMNMSGYYGEPELTGQVLKDGKIYSSDMGYQDEKGYIYLLGRKGDIINMGGIKISAFEIEKTALLWDEIKECACVSKPDEHFGEIPKLFVVLKHKDKFRKTEFEQFLKEKLERSRIPKEIDVISELPKTFNGKVKKKGLLER